jgi:hypothetical protein
MNPRQLERRSESKHRRAFEHHDNCALEFGPAAYRWRDPDVALGLVRIGALERSLSGNPIVPRLARVDGGALPHLEIAES